MKGSTHLAAGTITGLFISLQVNYSPITAAAFTAGAVIGSIIPDIDNASSKLGSRIGPVSSMIQLFIGHRTVFHGPLIYLLVFPVITWMYPDRACFINGIIAGIVSHLFLDMLNPAGIPLLWPLSKRFRIPLVRSCGFIDKILSVILWLLVPGLIIGVIF